MYPGSTPPACARSPAVSTPHPHRRDNIGNQPQVTGSVLTGHHRHLSDPLLPCQYRLDLTQLDTETADLDLIVGAPQVLQPAVPVPADHIPGPVHPLTRSAPERAGHKPLRSQPRTPQIPPRQLDTGEIELTRDTLPAPAAAARPGRTPGCSTSAARSAPWHRPRRPGRPGGDVHRGLGRPVQVVQRNIEQPRELITQPR